MKTLKGKKKDVWGIFSEYIRKRDCLRTTGSVEYGECITCDGHFEYRDLDAGHFIPGRRNANLFQEKGCHAQCRYCNRFRGGEQLKYRRAIIKLYGNGIDEWLEENDRQIKKFTISELEQLEKDLTGKLKEII